MRALTRDEVSQIQSDAQAALTTISVTASRPPGGGGLQPPTPVRPPVGGGGGGGGGGGFPKPVPPPCPPTPANTANQTYINGNEGPNSTSGYVPGNGAGVGSGSGVTAGFGVDLSQWMGSNLKSWGVSTAGQTAAAPYLATSAGQFGPHGTAAAALLAKNGPLNLSAADASAMTNGAFSTLSGRAASNFSSLTAGSNFLDLPSAVQTALVDVVYNSGSLTSAALPSGFSTAIQNMDWSQAAALLQQSGNPRLAQDGAMMAAAIQNKTLPASGAICH